jgi:hypothetical protein
MKRLFLISAILFGVIAANAQSLEEIIKMYTIANKLDKISGLKTIKISAKMSIMGMEIPTEMWMKNPNKIKSVSDFNGQKMIQTFDGVKAFSINPMLGSSDPVEMSAYETEQIRRSNAFNNYLEDYLKNGKLSLEGEEAINGKSAFKIKATIDAGTVLNLFIDKTSYLLVKTSGTVKNQGQEISLESIPSDYKEISGVLMPMKTTVTTSGIELVTTITNIEVNVPMEDTVFTLK